MLVRTHLSSEWRSNRLRHWQIYPRYTVDTVKLNMSRVSYISTAEKLHSVQQDTTCNLCTDVVHRSSEVDSSSAIGTDNIDILQSHDIVHLWYIAECKSERIIEIGRYGL